MRSPADLRRNLADIIHLVRSGGANSRRELALLLKVSPTTAGGYVDRLTASGHLQETGLFQGQMGRPKRTLRVCGDSGWFAGLEFNAARLHAVAIDFSGQTIASLRYRFPERVTAPAVCSAVRDALRELVDARPQPPLRVGLGLPGLVDLERGLGLEYVMLPDWKRVPIRDDLQQEFNLPTLVENNLRAIAKAEWWFGTARELQNYVVLGPRHGFGMAIVRGGQVISGSHHAAGEIGHWRWPAPHGSGLLQDSLSAPAVWQRLTGQPATAPWPDDLYTALAAHAWDDTPAWQDLTRDFGTLLGQLQLLLDIPHYFLHGPLTALGERFCLAVQHATISYAPSLAGRIPALVTSTLEDNAGALGAASVAMEAWEPDEAVVSVASNHQ